VTAKGGMWQVARVSAGRVLLVDLEGDLEGLSWRKLKVLAARAPGSALRTLEEISDKIALRELWPATAIRKAATV
jgi:hypothetical protein